MRRPTSEPPPYAFPRPPRALGARARPRHRLVERSGEPHLACFRAPRHDRRRHFLARHGELRRRRQHRTKPRHHRTPRHDPAGARRVVIVPEVPNDLGTVVEAALADRENAGQEKRRRVPGLLLFLRDGLTLVATGQCEHRDEGKGNPNRDEVSGATLEIGHLMTYQQPLL